MANRRGWAAVSGIGAVVLILNVGAFALLAVLANEPHDPTDSFYGPPPTGGDRALGVAAYLLVPLGLLLAGVLPVYALGVGLVESFIVSGVLAGFPTMLVVASGPSYGKVLTVLVTSPVLVVISASMLTNGARANVIVALLSGAIVAAVYVTYSTSVLVDYLVGLGTWIILPLVAGQFVPRSLQRAFVASHQCRAASDS